MQKSLHVLPNALLQDRTKQFCLWALHKASSDHCIGNYIVTETVVVK
jgi:hypothetical protein